MDLNASPWTFVAAFGALSVAMLLTMMASSSALIARPERPIAAKIWSVAYLVVWVAIVVLLGTTASRQSMPPVTIAAGLIAIAGGWLTLHLLWLWMWLAIEGASARRTGDAPPASADRLKHRAGQLAVAGLVAVACSLVVLGIARTFVALLVAPGHRIVAATLGLGVVGFALLVTGGARLALEAGTPMTREEIEELARATKYGPVGQTSPWVYRRSAYRVFGPAKGMKAEHETSIRAFKDAWRSGKWHRDRHWQTAFMMACGALAMLYGGFGTVVVIAPWLVKAVVALALAYATVQLVRAFQRA